MTKCIRMESGLVTGVRSLDLLEPGLGGVRAAAAGAPCAGALVRVPFLPTSTGRVTTPVSRAAGSWDLRSKQSDRRTGGSSQ
jgi:hypothetical protein